MFGSLPRRSGRYYAARERAMDDANARDDSYRIGTLADFEGVEVTGSATAALGACWHS